MKKNSKSRSTSVPRVDPYLEGLMAKLLERLLSLEKKMDTVIARTGGISSQSPEAGQPPRRDRILYEAVCADCSKVCEVPFKPSEDRAVYCKQCFARRKSLPAGRQAAGGSTRPGMPVLTPVTLPPKLVSKLNIVRQVPPAAHEIPKKAKKRQPTKKAKKKK